MTYLTPKLTAELLAIQQEVEFIAAMLKGSQGLLCPDHQLHNIAIRLRSANDRVETLRMKMGRPI